MTFLSNKLVIKTQENAMHSYTMTPCILGICCTNITTNVNTNALIIIEHLTLFKPMDYKTTECRQKNHVAKLIVVLHISFCWAFNYTSGWLLNFPVQTILHFDTCRWIHVMLMQCNINVGLIQPENLLHPPLAVQWGEPEQTPNRPLMDLPNIKWYLILKLSLAKRLYDHEKFLILIKVFLLLLWLVIWMLKHSEADLITNSRWRWIKMIVDDPPPPHSKK